MLLKNIPYLSSTLYITECVSLGTMFLWINDSGLFAWISYTAWSLTEFILIYPDMFRECFSAVLLYMTIS